MESKILIAGFGGQGMMILGKILAKAALYEGKETTYIPSYGAEMRGGTANCVVKISDLPIASPFIDYADIVIALNKPSLVKFKSKLKKGGVLVSNSDFISHANGDKKIKELSLPLNQIALDCGNIRVANTVVLGLILGLKPKLLKKSTLVKVLKETFTRKDILNQNLQALDKGESLSSPKERKNVKS